MVLSNLRSRKWLLEDLYSIIESVLQAETFRLETNQYNSKQLIKLMDKECWLHLVVQGITLMQQKAQETTVYNSISLISRQLLKVLHQLMNLE